MERAQRYTEDLRNNEKKYAVGKTWKMSFDYKEHKNVKQFMPYMREMLKQIKGHADNAHLSHYDAESLKKMTQAGVNAHDVFGGML